MKHFIFALVFACVAQSALMAAPSPTMAANLVMVEQDGCHWCAKWNAEIASIFPKTEEGKRAPLRRVDLHALPTDIRFSSPPVFTPTFVLVENGKELGRIEGYGGDEFFWFHLRKLLKTQPTQISPKS